MNKDRYKEDLRIALAELRAKLEKRVLLDREIAQLRLDISSLSQLVGEPLPPSPNYRLTDDCREVLLTSDERLTPPEVVDKLVAMGLRMPGLNLLPSVHTTLRRLAKKRNAEVLACLKGGKQAFYISHPVASDIADGYRISPRKLKG